MNIGFCKYEKGESIRLRSSVTAKDLISIGYGDISPKDFNSYEWTVLLQYIDKLKIKDKNGVVAIIPIDYVQK